MSRITKLIAGVGIGAMLALGGAVAAQAQIVGTVPDNMLRSDRAYGSKAECDAMRNIYMTDWMDVRGCTAASDGWRFNYRYSRWA